MKDGSGRKAGAPHPRRGRQRWTPYSNVPFIFDCRRDTEINLRTGPGVQVSSCTPRLPVAGVGLGLLALLCAQLF
jgi:hypothetical protein